MLRLLLYSHFFSPHVGGVETVVRELAQGLSVLEGPQEQRRFQITVATQTPASVAGDASQPFQILRGPSAMQLWKAVKAADVVHVAGTALGPMMLAMLARKPVVVEHHGFQVVCPNGQFFHEASGRFCPGHFMAGHRNECLRCCAQAGKLGAWRLWLLTHVRRFLCRFAARNILPTAWLGSLLAVPRMTAVLHGVPFPKDDAASEPSLHRFLFVGRLVPSKGVHLLIEAAQILKSQGRIFEIRVIGDGPERTSLVADASGKGVSDFIHFQQGLSDREVAAELKQSSAVVAPSLAGEVFGMVLAEAMTRGVPVIASDIGSFAEVMQDGGLLFQSGDATNLARQMSRVMEEPHLRNRLASQALHRSSADLTVQQMVEGHARIYEEVGSVRA